MRQHRDAILMSLILSCLILLCSFVTRVPHTLQTGIDHHIAALAAAEAQSRAASAYWLGTRGSAAQKAIPALVELLADDTPVRVTRYRRPGPSEAKVTVGNEAALALVNIGPAATDALIKVLINSPQPHARENAAWALGALHRRELV